MTVLRLSPSLTPLDHDASTTSSSSSDKIAILEMQSFNESSNPHNSLINLLYIYPQSLKYDTQKAFSKARNILCTVQLIVNNDEPAKVCSHQHC
jgi:hypothetical protein